MAYDTVTQVTDDVNDNLAPYANEKRTAIQHVMSAVAYGAYVNAQSMTANVTLTNDDFPVQSFSPTAARDLTLPAVASTNHAFYIVNRSATFAITVKNASSAVLGMVPVSSAVLYVSDGANGWYPVNDSWLVRANVQSMTGNVTLTDASLPVQSFSPTAARDLTLPTVASTNHPFYIINRSATYAITVKNSGGSTLGTVAVSSAALYFSDGTNGWYSVSGGGSSSDSAAEGVLVGGILQVTVVTNNITVAIKTDAGADPSSSSPVTVRIDGVNRQITSALSVTLNAGTQWFGLGTPFAALEQQFFAYVGWRAASSAVVLGFARFPAARVYSDFSATTTNEKHGAFSTAPASSDDVVVCGRFSATLSATPSFNWSVPTFTNNNLLQRPIWETDWMNWLPAPTGYSAVPTNVVYQYRFVGKMFEMQIREGTAGNSNATTLTMTAPFAALTLTNMVWQGYGSGTDNSAALTTMVIASITSGSSTLNFSKDPSGVTWTAAGTKRVGAWRGWCQYI